MTMDLATFEEILDLHGADLAHWPDDRRASAAALLATSEAARRALADASAVDAFLRADRPAPSEGVDAIAAWATAYRQERPVPPVVRRAGWAVAAGVALFLGLYVGGLATSGGDESGDSVIAASFDPGGHSYVD